MTIVDTRDKSSTIVQFASVFFDFTEQHKTSKPIEHDAYHDALTGLANSALFNDRLRKTIARAKRDNKMVSILFIDLDNFKQVNDHFGH